MPYLRCLHEVYLLLKIGIHDPVETKERVHHKMVSSFILGSEKEDMCSSHRLVKAINLDFSPKWIKGMALLFYHAIPRTNIHTGNREFNDTSEVWPI